MSDVYLAPIAVWLILAIFLSAWADRRGRNGTVWFVLSLVLSPLLAWIGLLAVGPKPKA